MSSLSFYLILTLFLIAFGLLFWHTRNNKKQNHFISKRVEPRIDLPPAALSEQLISQKIDIKKSAYDPNVIALQVKSFPGKPYMGYELLQTLLSLGLHFGEMNIFHRHEKENGDGNILFSVAAATPEGIFPIHDMGSFKCMGLITFVKFDDKQKLMKRFNLMLDIARQLIEELGGEIHDDFQQPINATVIKNLRERICQVETSNLYTADLLDNLD